MKRLFIAVAALALLAAACSSKSAPHKTMTVVGTEMAFTAPSTVPAGEYDVTFRNNGKVDHELAFEDPNGEVVTRRSIGAGQQVTLGVSLTPGKWELTCHEPGHYEAGMHAPLTVTAH